MKNLKVLAVAVLALGFSAAQAGLVYSNVNLSNNGNEATKWLQAEDFTLSASATLTSATVYMGVTAGAVPAVWDGNWQWGIYSSAGSQPDALLASGSGISSAVDSGQSFFNSAVYAFTFDLNDFAATAGQTYYLGIHAAKDFSQRAGLYWVGSHDSVGGTGQELYEGNTPWNSNGVEHAFSLSSDQRNNVPEPGSLALLLAAAAGMAAGYRRRAAR
ncbi:PEP-CTERM sorting domain-containing protein [Paucibacter sp. Y2R2-4]|uniref:PEP-CTERM sorting domain-containing protein n=1 Tax=Paucibacter sp. Y2R2-4 TaxID=2893553 RepID=UPI0021E4F5D9|nr:PEP-CTERM sorting domain-containing protein [Paucibacter sp. Y2R2-4]MCV2350137.1 PEP-CTERM sorting domain-containing protein [Paucibacter sp. Y2R2-4]